MHLRRKNTKARLQRPSAKELLKHRFVKSAKKSSYLTELIDRQERWNVQNAEKDDDGEEGA